MRKRIFLALIFANIGIIMCTFVAFKYKKTDTIKTAVMKSDTNQYYLLIDKGDSDHFKVNTSIFGTYDDQEVMININDKEEIKGQDAIRIYFTSNTSIDQEILKFAFKGESWAEYIFHKVI